MTRTIAIAIVCAAAWLGAGAAAQEPAALAEYRAMVESMGQAGGTARVAVEARLTRGKPYSGEAVTEFVQVLGDGNRITRKTSARLFRDSDGRTRREEGADAEHTSVAITDPVSGTSFILHPGSRTATKTTATFARFEGGTASYTISRGAGARGAAGGEPKVEVITIPDAELRQRVEATAQAVGRGGATIVTTPDGATRAMVTGPVRGDSTKEDLGQQQIEGVTATGTRTTTVIPSGAIGNEQPITIVSEQWFSADLNVLVLTRHSDPRVGETTYRLTNISLAEPDRSLFQVPSDYTIEELRRPPVMWQQR